MSSAHVTIEVPGIDQILQAIEGLQIRFDTRLRALESQVQHLQETFNASNTARMNHDHVGSTQTPTPQPHTETTRDRSPIEDLTPFGDPQKSSGDAPAISQTTSSRDSVRHNSASQEASPHELNPRKRPLDHDNVKPASDFDQLPESTVESSKRSRLAEYRNPLLQNGQLLTTFGVRDSRSQIVERARERGQVANSETIFMHDSDSDTSSDSDVEIIPGRGHLRQESPFDPPKMKLSTKVKPKGSQHTLAQSSEESRSQSEAPNPSQPAMGRLGQRNRKKAPRSQLRASTPKEARKSGRLRNPAIQPDGFIPTPTLDDIDDMSGATKKN